MGLYQYLIYLRLLKGSNALLFNNFLLVDDGMMLEYLQHIHAGLQVSAHLYGRAAGTLSRKHLTLYIHDPDLGSIPCCRCTQADGKATLTWIRGQVYSCRI